MTYLKLLMIPILACSLILLPSCDENEEVSGEICNNGIDDDMDGDIDCDDADCTAFSGCIATGSDLRIKEDIVPLKPGLETVLQLETFSFKYIDSDGQHLGLMAQDVQKLLPEIVIDDPASEEDIMAIRYQELIPVLINAIQEQQKQIEALKLTNQELTVNIE